MGPIFLSFLSFPEKVGPWLCRCRHGYFHVVNNDYSHWIKYAIGGSAAPTINSQGNRFLAPNSRYNKEVRTPVQETVLQPLLFKSNYCTLKLHGPIYLRKNVSEFQVTKHENAPQSVWKNWNWRSKGDLLLNGAFFTPSGAGASSSYAKASSLSAKSSTLVSAITAGAGALKCKKGSYC